MHKIFSSLFLLLFNLLYVSIILYVSILLYVSIHNIKTTSASKMFLACVCDKTRRGESRTTLREHASLPLTLCFLMD